MSPGQVAALGAALGDLEPPEAAQVALHLAGEAGSRGVGAVGRAGPALLLPGRYIYTYLHNIYTISTQLRADLMLGTSAAAVRLIMFSLGVHIAETVDMAATRQLSLLSLHHVAVILCFAGALASSKGMPEPFSGRELKFIRIRK